MRGLIVTVALSALSVGACTTATPPDGVQGFTALTAGDRIRMEFDSGLVATGEVNRDRCPAPLCVAEMAVVERSASRMVLSTATADGHQLVTTYTADGRFRARQVGGDRDPEAGRFRILSGAG